jgi:hypothetical protein
MDLCELVVFVWMEENVDVLDKDVDGVAVPLEAIRVLVCEVDVAETDCCVKVLETSCVLEEVALFTAA